MVEQFFVQYDGCSVEASQWLLLDEMRNLPGWNEDARLDFEDRLNKQCELFGELLGPGYEIFLTDGPADSPAPSHNLLHQTAAAPQATVNEANKQASAVKQALAAAAPTPCTRPPYDLPTPRPAQCKPLCTRPAYDLPAPCTMHSLQHACTRLHALAHACTRLHTLAHACTRLHTPACESPDHCAHECHLSLD